jgi:hypothetical protein
VAVLENILQRHAVWRGAAPSASLSEAPAIPTGFPALDRELPGGGWPAGGLTELLGERDGIGELQLVLPALAALTRQGKRVQARAAPPAVCTRTCRPGDRPDALVVVRAPGGVSALWAAGQVLRAGSCHALLARAATPAIPSCGALAVCWGPALPCALLFRPLAARHRPRPATCASRWSRGPAGGPRAHPQAPGRPDGNPVPVPVNGPFMLWVAASTSLPPER